VKHCNITPQLVEGEIFIYDVKFGEELETNKPIQLFFSDTLNRILRFGL